MRTRQRWQLLPLGLVGALFLFGTVATVPAQKDGKKVDKPKGERGRLVSIIRSGYTRPGSPSDGVNKDGSIRPLAWDDHDTGKLIGATVYFAVLEQTGDEADPWGVGVGDFVKRFSEGKSFQGGYAPALDTRARYLYLYMVVNDRGLDPRSRTPADWGRDLRTSPIAGAAVKLLVDPHYITSWGHFKGLGLTANVPDRNFKGDSKDRLHLAVSANPSILAELRDRRYAFRCPAYPLGELTDSLNLGLSTLNLARSSAYKELESKKRQADQGKTKLAAWAGNMIQAAAEAREPGYVQLLYPRNDALGAPLVGAGRDGCIDVGAGTEAGFGVFRADWRGDNVIKLGHHSVVFGFTSNLPPVDEGVRVEDLEEAMRGNGIDGTAVSATATGVAAGTVVTPAPPPSLAGCCDFGGGFLGGHFGGGFGAFGFPGFPVGAIGFAPPFSGGWGGGFGGGRNNDQAPTQTVNFSATLTNQQNQSQSQKQQQQQQQSQSQTPDAGHVVPAPAGLILGLLGLPALLLLRRRKTLAPDP